MVRKVFLVRIFTHVVRAYAERLLEAGAKVCLSDLDRAKGERTLSELGQRFGTDKVCFSLCDVTQEEDLESLLDDAEQYFKVGCVDILVNNAGVNVNLGWRKVMNINIMGIISGKMHRCRDDIASCVKTTSLVTFPSVFTRLQ